MLKVGEYKLFKLGYVVYSYYCYLDLMGYGFFCVRIEWGYNFRVFVVVLYLLFLVMMIRSEMKLFENVWYLLFKIFIEKFVV